MSFRAVNKDLLFSRNDASDPRLGEFVSTSPSREQTANTICIAGYPDDDGIGLNGGRLGAKEGPDAIRRYLYRMTPPAFEHELGRAPLCDLGNLAVDIALADRHQTVLKTVKELLNAGQRYLGLGGGHDYGFPDGAAFLESQAGQQKPLVINFDAHLDVRPLDKGLSSGTPFYRLLSDYSEFDFVEIGVQKHCNSHQHAKWCRDNGGHILSYDQIALSGQPEEVSILNFLEVFLKKGRPTYISVDIDAFSSSYAMGCSQSWPTGLKPEAFFKVFETLLSRLNVTTLGIYEVSPALDHDGRTAKLAAQIAYEFIYSRGPS